MRQETYRDWICGGSLFEKNPAVSESLHGKECLPHTEGRLCMRICLDAGHYGKYNQSPADSRYYESEMMWKLHLLQKKYLEEYGIEVVTTRDTQETDLGLYARGAASAGCDLFLSDHSNAVGSGANSTVDYPAAYCAIDGSADGIGMALAQCVEQMMKTSQPARIEHRRGSRGDYYGVLRGATAVGTPGLILEHSFHTNGAVAAWLLNEENLDRLAKAEADTIALYYNLLMPEPEKKSGWYQEEGGWRYYLGNTGDPVRNDWHKSGADWYWFDGAGFMVHNDWKQGSDGTWYYLKEDGSMAKDEWIVWKGELYRVLEDGAMFLGCMCLETNEKGALLTGFGGCAARMAPVLAKEDEAQEKTVSGGTGSEPSDKADKEKVKEHEKEKASGETRRKRKTVKNGMRRRMGSEWRNRRKKESEGKGKKTEKAGKHEVGEGKNNRNKETAEKD